ncbi:centrosomal protein of 131 kDa [Cyclospora cayetanensis]|uniref:Centrosomal protein of 131 kDa n=1 Tax=Cyclospora cayetanensis TaxID=88456 RepID=A0A6P6RU77_9EIME|nr:centrosomal protein of 131 kDa [Cyclospora cayetanensis]
MTLTQAVSAATCGVSTAGMPQSLDHQKPKHFHDKASSIEPSGDRMRDFLSFLDRSTSGSVMCDSTAHTPFHPPANTASNANLLSRISALEVELEDKEHNLKALRELREREKLKEEHIRKQLQLQLRDDLTKTTEKYEQHSRSQQQLLVQLQDEKKDMASRYQRLADEMRELERKFGAKTAELHKQYGRELERQRKAFLCGEKARREAWERDRAQEIKEITIRGLEPEIQRLIEKHRNEKRCLEEKLKGIANEVRPIAPVCKTSMCQSFFALVQKALLCVVWHIQPDHMKKQLEREVSSQKAIVTRQMEEALQVERDQHKQEIRLLQENFGAQLENEKHILQAKHQEEAARWESQMRDEKMSAEAATTKAREEEQMRCKEATSELITEIERMRQAHEAELRQATAAAKANQNETIIAMEAAKAAAIQEAVAATKKEVEEECHRKLDHLLKRLSQEQLEAQTRFERQCNEAVAASQDSADRLRQEFTKERNKLESELKVAHEKRLDLERLVSRLETEAELREKVRAELQMALDEVSGRTKQHRHDLAAQKELIESMSAQLSEAKTKMEEIRQKEGLMLETIEAKVKEALFAKDQSIQRLQDELSASNTRVKHLKDLMNRQRSELTTGASRCDSFSLDSTVSTSASLLPSLEKVDTEIGAKSLVLSKQQGVQLRSRCIRGQSGAKIIQEQKKVKKNVSH